MLGPREQELGSLSAAPCAAASCQSQTEHSPPSSQEKASALQMLLKEIKGIMNAFALQELMQQTFLKFSEINEIYLGATGQVRIYCLH